MAAQKQTKPELIAIYRLEFYKKQKNWKLSSDAKREKDKQKCKINTKTKLLNETYCIETNNNGDEDNDLNDAFLNDESDKEAITPQPMLHTQSLAPIHACQECYQVDKPQNPWADYVADDEGSPWAEWGLDKCSGDNELEGFEGPVDGMVWTNSAQQQGWTGDTPAQVNMFPDECAEGRARADSLYEQFLPWPDDQLWMPEIWAEDRLLLDSLEDIEQFLVGAHSAPHSSEIELCAPDEGGLESNLSISSVAQLSGAQLAAAVQRHADTLQLLLREGQRRRFKSTLSLEICAANHFEVTPRDVFSTEYSYEAFPTRDVGFNPLHGANTPKQYGGLEGIQRQVELNPLNKLLNRVGSTRVNSQLLQGVGSTPVGLNMLRDEIVGGSFKNMPGFVGRGRGRLPDNNDF